MSGKFDVSRRLVYWVNHTPARKVWRNFMPDWLRRLAADKLVSAFLAKQISIRVDAHTVLLADFPRCGNTWIRYLLATVLHWRETGSISKLSPSEFYHYCPTLAGQAPHEPYYFGNGTSLLKTHLPHREEFRRGIVTYRNPFESIRSLYVLTCHKSGISDQDFHDESRQADFLLKWATTYRDFYTGWADAYRNNPANFQFIKYEELVAHTPFILSAMIRFIGLGRDIPDSLIEEVAHLYSRRDVSWRDEKSWKKRQDAEITLSAAFSADTLYTRDPQLAGTLDGILQTLEEIRLRVPA